MGVRRGSSSSVLILVALCCLTRGEISAKVAAGTTQQLSSTPTGVKHTSAPIHHQSAGKINNDYYAAKTLSSTDSEVSSILGVESKDILVDKNPRLEDDVASEKIQEEEVAKVIKAQANSKKARVPSTSASSLSQKSSHPTSINSNNYNASDSQALKRLLEAETTDNEDIDAEDEDDDEDDYDEDDDDDDDDDDDEEADINDDEEIISGCPDYCRCVGQLASATTARCSKLQDDQTFGSGIAHLKISNAGDIRLGPHALRRLGLHQLESISIVGTKIVELDRTAFDGLRELFVVNLTHNSLVNLHPDTFQNNSQLSLLTIAGNPLKLTPTRRGSSDFLLDAPSVTELDFSGNELTKLPKRAFAKMTNLAYISLRNNRLSNIEKDLFRPLDSLVELDLSHNDLKDLPADLFKGKNLQTLRISGNGLTTLSAIKAPKLMTLDASMNHLKVIAKEDLNGVPYLDQLYLSNNLLKRIHQHAFSELDQLTYLDLSNNNLPQIDEHHFRANSRLQVLLLSNNPYLETLPVFRTNAEEFERYSIYRFECENCGLVMIESGTFDAMAAMTRLNLANNKLTSLPKELLRSLSALRELDISMNSFDKLDDDMFEGATSLSKLSIAGNSFVSGLRVTPFLKMPSLSRLDASYCNMKKIWSETKSPINSLKYLLLHKNRLTSISLAELEAMPKLAGLDVSRNPLHCDDDLSIAIQWLSEKSVIPTESSRANGYQKHDFDYEQSENEPLNQWSDLAKKLCDSWEMAPPSSRGIPRRNNAKKTKTIPEGKPITLESSLDAIESDLSSLPGPFSKFNFSQIDKQLEQFNKESEEIDDDSDVDSQDPFSPRPIHSTSCVTIYSYSCKWYERYATMLVMLLTIVVHLILFMSRRRGNDGSPVIRAPKILRPGFVDNKNCGLVYKPLQEEIAQPHQTKRGNFYSSSKFHYDKILPESV